ncbi:hypothetical protein [Kibdelosporangium phytohabitans]|uniref:Uncharacterized protein n=1 Tax=Kibdelosporangium phytohabitans TaxID=860235 RepID=A0A0N9HMU9_9PSEU|nr:hypothetical protein [Kibdelosporangium phytohabitans]ALG08211.1 hypothetical protein AOZ06_15995 [Kibdelosporangium phytohabitans]MBE1470787.1 hypothetical protein [Kibdelosporangium phytohabitans]
MLHTDTGPQSIDDGWGCSWSLNSKSLSIWFDRETPPVTRDQPRRFQADSRMVYPSEAKTEDMQSCRALIDHRQLTGVNQQWYVETVTVAVERHKPSTVENDLCIEATRLARVVVARLPN